MGGFNVTINQQRRGMASKKHKRIIKMAKGYRGRSKNTFRAAVRRVEKGLQYAYRDRKTKKRNFRKLWIERINAGVRQHGMSYSKFINAMANMGEAELNSLEIGNGTDGDVEDTFEDIDEREEMDKMPEAQEGQMILNRKMLADLAANEPFSFKAVVDVVKMQSASGGK
jgi:large subunit ribosomal protein L20